MMHYLCRLGVRASLLMAFAALVCPGVVSAQQPPKEAPLTIKVGMTGKPMLYWSVLGGEPLGFFKKENLNVEFIGFRTDSSMLGAMVAGDLDLSIVGLDSALRAHQGGAKIRVVAASQLNTNSINVAKDIQRIEDLKGKDIAIYSAEEGSTVAFLAMLAANGMTSKDVHMIAVGATTDRFSALVAKKVSAAILSQPHDFVGDAEGYKIVARSIIDAPPVAGYMVALRDSTPAKDETLKRFLRAMKATIDWSVDPKNKAELIRIWAGYYKVSEEIAARVYQLYVTDAKIWSQGITPDLDRVDAIGAMVEKYTRFRAGVPPRSIVDMSLVKAIQ